MRWLRQSCRFLPPTQSVTSAVAPRISTTCTRVPASYVSSSMYARAVQTSPSIRTHPTPSSLAIRSSTIAGLPTSAAVPVRRDGGIRLCDRASGRSAASRTIEITRNTASEPTNGTPAALTTPATAAPPANGARKKPSVAISPTPKITAKMSHSSQSSMDRSYLPGSAGEELFQRQDAPEDRERRRVRRVHAVVAEPARAERARLGVWRVGGVVDDPEVDRELGEVDRLPDGVAVDVGDLVDRVAVRPG